MKVLISILLVIFSISLLGQIPKELIIDKEWKTHENNIFKITEDSIQLDGFKWGYFYLTDSSIFVLNQYSTKKVIDTILKINYEFLKTGLKLTFSNQFPSELNCDFAFQHLCHLKGRNGLYFNSTKGVINIPTTLKSIEINTSAINLKIDSLGYIFFSTNGNYYYLRNLLRNTNPSYENQIVRGIYKGKLSTKNLKLLNELVIEQKILWSYLGIDFYQKDEKSTLEFNVKWNDKKWNDKKLQANNNKLSQFIYGLIFLEENISENQILAYGLIDSNNGMHFSSYDTKSIKYGGKFKTVSGIIKLKDSVKTKNESVYIYMLTVDSTYHEKEIDYVKNDIEYLTSDKIINITQSQKIGIVYNTQTANYIDINNKWYNYEYPNIVDTFPLNNYILFPFHLSYYTYQYRKRHEIEKMKVIYNHNLFDWNRFYQSENNYLPIIYPSTFDYELVSKLKKYRNQPFLNKIKN